jgi:hypothetical protein
MSKRAFIIILGSNQNIKYHDEVACRVSKQRCSRSKYFANVFDSYFSTFPTFFVLESIGGNRKVSYPSSNIITVGSCLDNPEVLIEYLFDKPVAFTRLTVANFNRCVVYLIENYAHISLA